MPATAFLSYARENGDFALRLGRDLKSAGVDLWIDQLAITGGELWDHAVQEALEGCSTLVVILSPEAIASRSVMDEVAFALDEGKRVVPVVYRSCKTPFRLRRLHYVDFTADYATALSHLGALLATAPRAAPRPPDAAATEQRAEQETAARQAAEREAAERAAAEAAKREREARERAEQAQRERQEREQAEREAGERAAAARAEQALREREAQERKEREARERAQQKRREQEPGARLGKHVVIGLGLLAVVIVALITVLPNSGAPTLVRLHATPESLAMSIGDIRALPRLEGVYSDGSSSPAVLDSVVWRSSDTSLVTFDILSNVRARAPGRAIVTASYSGLEAAVVVAVDRPATNADRTASAPGGRRPDIVPTAVSSTGTIRGTVHDNLGQPVSAQVRLEGSTQAMIANAQGSFSFAGMAPGRWPVIAQYIGYVPETTTVLVAAGRTASVSLILRPAYGPQADIPVATSGTIRGHVRDTTNAPVSAAALSVVGTALSAVASADGSYLLADVPVGTWSVRVRALGYEPVTTTVRVAGGQTAMADVTVRPAQLQLAEVVVQRLPQDADRITLRLLESTDSGRTGMDRSQAFDAMTLRWVMPYIILQHPPAPRAATDTLRCAAYPPGGGAAQTTKVLLAVRAGETRSLASAVWGSATPGTWQRGRHRVECSWRGTGIASGSFTVR